MATTNMDSVVSHWSHLFSGMQYSPDEFYTRLEQALKEKEIPNAKCTRITFKEGGLLSAKRTYLRVMGKDHYYDICAAPYGHDFFFSSWLCVNIKYGCLLPFMGLPIIGHFMSFLLPPETYFQRDTASMFLTAVHNVLMAVIDETTQAKGITTLVPEDRRPTMREIFKNAG